MPNVHFSFRRGAGDVPEILYGKVEIKPTLAFARGTSLVLPAPTTLDLVNGEATANNVYPTPAPVAGQVEWAYRVKAIDTRGQSFEWMVGVPDSTGTVEFTSLPRYFETKPPLFGKGEKGDPGEAAKISVGTTSSGTAPSVTNTGTNQNAVLDFVLPKGDKGDKGDGVPAGGSALQYIRKDATGAVTEWATMNKGTVGLANVDNTSDSNKPVSSPQKTYIDQHNTLSYRSRTVNQPPQDYPVGITVVQASKADGWPDVGPGLVTVITFRTQSPSSVGGTVQWVYSQDAPQNYPLWRSYTLLPSPSWGEWQSGDTNLPYKAGTTNFFVAAGAGNSNTGEGPTDTSVNGGYELVGVGVDALRNNQRGWKNTAVGFSAMRDNVDGYFNVAIGNSALERTVGGIGMDAPNPNAPGSRNVAIGSNAMRYNVTGRSNVAIGRNAAHSSVSGDYNTAVGTNAFSGVVDEGVGSDKTSSYNTAIGWGTVFLTLSEGNTAVGAHALYQADGGVDEGYNTAVGFYALSATGGGYNVAMGYRAGIGLKAGNTNIAIGKDAIGITTSGRGTQNIALGTESIGALTTGNNNVGMGYRALNSVTTGSNNVAIGHGAATSTSSGRSNITVVGAGAVADGDFSIAIGSGTSAVTSNAVAIGASVTASGASGVVLGHMGQSSATYAVAIGREANAGHTSSIALGDRTSTSATNQIAMGTRHIALSPVTAPTNPVDGGRLYIVNSGGKSSLRVKFPTGAEITLATEA